MGTANSIDYRKQIHCEFQVFAKPAGPSCNLGCDYCYYLDKAKLFGEDRFYRMPDDVLETYIRQHIEASAESVITFSWHGGEPLLAGLDFYRKAIAIQQKYCPPGKKFINGMQTNGTLLDDKWCSFLAGEHFVVGISVDGPEELHNRFRKAKDGKGSFKKVLHGYDLLVLHGIDPEILCVVNAENVKHPLEVYRFLKMLGAGFLTFIPLVEKLTNGHIGVSQRSVPAKAFGNFLCAIFDEWVAKDIGKIKVQIFEEALRTAFNQEHTLCIFKPVCGGVPVVEHNGDLYSCDHYVNGKHLLGNIRDIALTGILVCDEQQAFGKAKQLTLPRFCINCEVLPMCNGECPKNRFIRTPDGEPGLNYLCAGYKSFFNHCRPFAEVVAKAWRGT
jgi:uncharacterized protein